MKRVFHSVWNFTRYFFLWIDCAFSDQENIRRLEACDCGNDYYVLRTSRSFEFSLRCSSPSEMASSVLGFSYSWFASCFSKFHNEYINSFIIWLFITCSSMDCQHLCGLFDRFLVLRCSETMWTIFWLARTLSFFMVFSYGYFWAYWILPRVQRERKREIVKWNDLWCVSRDIFVSCWFFSFSFFFVHEFFHVEYGCSEFFLVEWIL